MATIVLLALSGCSASTAASDFAEGSSTHTIEVDGLDRAFITTVPNDLDENAPLVLVLHGGFGSAVQAQKAYGWDALAAENGFVVAYPDGLGRAWNAGDGCCGNSGERDVDDVTFVTDVVDELAGALPIDTDRVYIAGMSNGAMMAYRLACDTDYFAGVAAIAGTQLGECSDPTPTSVLHVHGEDDESVRLDGEAGSGAENIDGMPVAALHKQWLSIDGCPEPTVSVTPPVTTSTAACGSTDVTLTTIAGAGHQWPGSTRSAAQERMGTDVPSDAVDATEAAWAFFSTHER